MTWEEISEKNAQLSGWLCRNFGVRREDAEDCVQEAWRKIGFKFEWSLFQNAGRQAAIDLLRRASSRYECQMETMPDNCTERTLEDEVLSRETLSELAEVAPTAMARALGCALGPQGNTEKSRIHREREKLAAMSDTPAWIGRRVYELPPRCKECKRLIEFDKKGENVPCKCLQPIKLRAHEEYRAGL